MYCHYCRKNNAEVCFFDHGNTKYVCDHLCLEGVLHEEWTKSQGTATEEAGEGGLPVGKTPTLPDLRQDD